MANRNWANGGKVFSMHAYPVLMTASISIGASGAVSSFTGAAVSSVSRVSAGLYKLTLASQTMFPRLLSACASMQSPGSGLSGISAVEVQNAPNSALATSAGGTIEVTCLAPTSSTNTALVATDPASGSVLNVQLICSNSSVTIGGE